MSDPYQDAIVRNLRAIRDAVQWIGIILTAAVVANWIG